MFQACAALLLLWIATGTLATYFARTRLEEARALLIRDFAAHEASFKSDVEALTRNPLFAPHQGPDASPAIFAHVRWAKFSCWRPTLIGAPPLPEPLMSNISKWGAEWPKHVNDRTSINSTCHGSQP